MGNAKREDDEPEDVDGWEIPPDIYLSAREGSWEAKLDILEDEPWSSYFTRVAKANYGEPVDIIREQGSGERRDFKFRFDLDIHTRTETLEKLAPFIGQPVNRLREACLREPLNWVTGKQNPRRQYWQYVIEPIDGVRYCRLCLAEDAVTYFRYYWRLKFITACTKHSCFLDEKCPHCNEPVKYWLTAFDQSITTCFNCGGDILAVDKPVQKVDTDSSYQDDLLETWKTESLDGTPVDRDSFLVQLWKVAWAETADRETKIWKDSWEPETFGQSVQGTFHALKKALETVRLYPERLERPFNCLNCGKLFKHSSILCSHEFGKHGTGKTAVNSTCPIEGCQSKSIRLYRDNFKCRKCKTVFSSDGEIIEKGETTSTVDRARCPNEDCQKITREKKGDDYYCRVCGTVFTVDGTASVLGKRLHCPNEDCQSGSTYHRGNEYRCKECGTVFTTAGEILKKGRRLNCPNDECKSSSTIPRGKNYFCKICGAVFTVDGVIKQAGRKMRCPNEQCQSSAVRALLDGNFVCLRCSAVFTINAEVVKEGYSLRCPNEECNSPSYNSKGDRFRCHQCGTEFTINGEILVKREKMQCPNAECGSWSIYVKGDDYRCRACGTEFTSTCEIIKKGRKMHCPASDCGSKQVRVRGEGYTCFFCGTEFTIEGIVIKQGKRMHCTNEDCKSTNVKIKGKGYKCQKCGAEFTAD